MAHVLIVDDEAGIRNTIRIFLEAAGHTVRVASDAAEASHLLEDGTTEVVLTDIVMPGEDGLCLLKQVRQATPHVQVILMAAEPTVESATEALRMGAFDYLPKPLRKEAVCRVVGKAEQVHNLRRENEILNEVNRRHKLELESLVAQRTQDLQDTTDKLKAALGRLSRFLDDSIETMAMTVEVRDPYTAGHQRHVAELTAALAAEMGLPPEVRDVAFRAAQVHDIGKIAVPLDFLAKPSHLTELEFCVIKVHCKVGYDLLSRGHFPWPIADIVYQHHERLDGTGYPQGLMGDQIRIEARIITVADLVEAMSAHRPYRPALGMERAMEEVERGRGTRYDSQVADACLDLIRNRGWNFPKSVRP